MDESGLRKIIVFSFFAPGKYHVAFRGALALLTIQCVREYYIFLHFSLFILACATSSLVTLYGASTFADILKDFVVERLSICFVIVVDSKSTASKHKCTNNGKNARHRLFHQTV